MIRKIDIHLHPMGGDTNMEKYLRIMDKHNVEAGLLHGLEEEGWERPEFKGETANDALVKAVKAHPKRFYGSVCVNFSKGIEKTIDTIKKYGDQGCIGIKLFPNCGFDPNEDKYEPIWLEVEKRKMLVFSHCGWLLDNDKNPAMRISSLDGASPFHFEVPARRHPKINFIFAHFGGGATYLETLVLTSRLKNAFADTCPGWGRWVFEQNMPGLSAMFRNKLLYGTDNIGEVYGLDETWWTNKLTSLGFTLQDIHMYFYENSAKILGIVN
ncbi:MAG: amidohydrolase family protein [Candidatus Firestonebacteria bacterium]